MSAKPWHAARNLASNAIAPYTLAIAKLRGYQAMTTLTVTARGQVTFRKDVLRHLGIQPGQKIELDLLPDGRYDQQLHRTAGPPDKESGHP